MPISFIISINSSCAVSGISSKTNAKGDLTKGKSLLDISGKYLESFLFQQSKCLLISQIKLSFKPVTLLPSSGRAARIRNMPSFI
jgi:hypothetical protein